MMKKKKQGFASLTKKQRSENGRKAGKATAKKYGSEFFSKIGKKGGEQTAKKGTGYMQNIGKKGYKQMIKSIKKKNKGKVACQPSDSSV